MESFIDTDERLSYSTYITASNDTEEHLFPSTEGLHTRPGSASLGAARKHLSRFRRVPPYWTARRQQHTTSVIFTSQRTASGS